MRSGLANREAPSPKPESNFVYLEPRDAGRLQLFGIPERDARLALTHGRGNLQFSPYIGQQQQNKKAGKRTQLNELSVEWR